jgi:hypothetical protein
MQGGLEVLDTNQGLAGGYGGRRQTIFQLPPPCKLTPGQAVNSLRQYSGPWWGRASPKDSANLLLSVAS